MSGLSTHPETHEGRGTVSVPRPSWQYVDQIA